MKKLKHNNPKPVGHCNSSPRGKFIATQAYLKKQEKSQINNLTLHLKPEKAMAPISSTLAWKIP